jgi:hypothetical protein
MTAVNYDRIEIGDPVKVPRFQFNRTNGWDGWLFADARIKRKTYSHKTGRKMLVVDMQIFIASDRTFSVEKEFFAEEVFVQEKLA